MLPLYFKHFLHFVYYLKTAKLAETCCNELLTQSYRHELTVTLNLVKGNKTVWPTLLSLFLKRSYKTCQNGVKDEILLIDVVVEKTFTFEYCRTAVCRIFRMFLAAVSYCSYCGYYYWSQGMKWWWFESWSPSGTVTLCTEHRSVLRYSYRGMCTVTQQHNT
jgi:hypothetical protein